VKLSTSSFRSVAKDELFLFGGISEDLTHLNSQYSQSKKFSGFIAPKIFLK